MLHMASATAAPLAEAIEPHTRGDAVAEAVRRSVPQFRVRGCAGLMAPEFGAHPEAAVDACAWIWQLVGEMPASSVCPASGSTRRAA